MRATIFTRGRGSHSYDKEMAFKSGLERHGIFVNVKLWMDEPDSDLSVIWGVHNQRIVNHDLDCLVLENGYIGDRKLWVSCGFNGLNGRADFVRWKADDERLWSVRDYLRPQKFRDDGDIVIMGQVPTDASVKRIGYDKWLNNTIADIKQITEKRIYLRPHPLDGNKYNKIETICGSLQDALNMAACIVTLNSNSGVDATLAGAPCIATDIGSMAWDVTNHNISDILNLKFFDREQWLKEMSYCQWSMAEMFNGDAWEHLKGYYYGR